MKRNILFSVLAVGLSIVLTAESANAQQSKYRSTYKTNTSSYGNVLNKKIPSGAIGNTSAGEVKVPNETDLKVLDNDIKNVYLRRGLEPNWGNAARFFVQNGVAYSVSGNTEGLSLVKAGFENFVKQYEGSMEKFKEKAEHYMERYSSGLPEQKASFESLFAEFRDILSGNYKGYENKWTDAPSVGSPNIQGSSSPSSKKGGILDFKNSPNINFRKK